MAISFIAKKGLFARRQILVDSPLVAVQDFAQYPAVITPNADFFVRNHFAQLVIDVSTWALRVTGAVKHPQIFRYSDLQKMKHRTLTATLECAGNGAGEGAVGCAVWSGPMLSELLERCGLDSRARCVRFVGADQGIEPDAGESMAYSRSIPVDAANDPDIILASRMNGSPLPMDSGFPIRLLRPGFYGMDSVKWIEKIEVLSTPDLSFFMTRRYLREFNAKPLDTANRVGPVQVKAIIVQPGEAAVVHGTTVEIGGYAWGGRERIDRVEVTTDNGKSWHRSYLLADSGSLGWTPWKFQWLRAQPGVQSIAARAIGVSGRAQPSTRDIARLDKYELNQYHQVTFRVAL